MTKIKTLLIFCIFSACPAVAQEYAYINVNRVCAAIVNIPYASDNFTDEEWNQFQDCVKFIDKFDRVE